MPKIVDHEAQRNRIAEAALAAIGRAGLDKVRLVDVARAVDATTGTVTHYFDGKDALLVAALDRLAGRIHESAGRVVDRDPIEAAADTLPVDEAGLVDWRVWLAFWGRAISSPELAAVHNAHYDRIHAALTASIVSAQSAGRLAPTLDAPDLADAVMAAIDGIGVRAALAPEEWPAARQRALAERMLRPLLAPSE